MVSSSTPLYTSPNGTVYVLSGADSNCTISVCPVEDSVYGYRPSIPASVTLIALYALCMVVQSIMGVRYKQWGYMTAMLLGCADEILGYVGRILMYQNPFKQPGFIMQIVLITIGPVFFSAAIYVMLYKITNHISRASARFDPKYYYYGFVPCDIVSLILQAAGGAMSSTSNGSSTAGVNISLAGLSFQIITLVVFFTLAADYAIRSRVTWSKQHLPTKFKLFVGSLLLAAVLIFIRCCYRVYELKGGYSRNSKALRDQSLFIGLESVMIIVAAYALIVSHPGPIFMVDRQEPRLESPTELAESRRLKA